ncbi:glycoside hydrolase 5 family protein [Paenibacillus sp. strain BS8-2]
MTKAKNGEMRKPMRTTFSRRISIMLLFLFVAINATVPSGQITANELSQVGTTSGIGIEQTALGNVFQGNEKVEFNLYTQSQSIKWQVTDFWDNQVADGSSEVKNGMLKLKLPVKENGYYTLKLTAYHDGVQAGQAETVFAILDDYPFAAVSDSPFGVQTHFVNILNNPAWDPKIMPLVSKMGAKWIRDELPWGKVEPDTRGDYQFPDYLTNYMNAAKEQGLSSYSILNYGNKLYDVDDEGFGAAPHTEEGIQGYASYAVALLQQYGDQIKGVEVWNEYNSTAPWNRGPCKSDPNCYYEMLKATYEAVKAANPDVLVTGPAGVTLPYGWLERLFATGALDYLDAVTVHPYKWWAPDTVVDGTDASTKRVEDLIKQYNNGGFKPIWFSEIGFPTSTQGKQHVDEATQAQYVIPTYVMAASEGLEKLFWYDFMNDGLGEANQEHNFGLIRNAGDKLGAYTPKPSYVSYAVMARQLTGAAYVERDNAPEDVFSYVFNKNNEDVRVIWSRSGKAPQNVTLETNDHLTITDMMGRESNYRPYDGKIYLTLTGEPLYIEGNVDSISAGSMIAAEGGSALAGEDIPLTLKVNGEGLSHPVPVKFEVSGSQHSVHVQARAGEEAEEQVLLPAGAQPGTRTYVVQAKIGGKDAGRLVTSVKIDEPINLLNGAATAVLGSQSQFYGLTARAVGGSNLPKVVTRAGVEGWQTDKASQQLYFYLGIDDRYIFDGTNSVQVTVDYFDEGTGKFALAYDSTTSQFQYTPSVQLENSGTWKQVQFQWDDAKLSNRIANDDFRIGIYSPEFGTGSSDIVIAKITVKSLNP